MSDNRVTTPPGNRSIFPFKQGVSVAKVTQDRILLPVFRKF
jgi:hypothetical protein